MTFPRTSVLDDFDRGDGDAGANWSEMWRSGNDFNIASNKLVDDGWNAEIWNPSTYGPACEGYITMSTLHGQDDQLLVYLRAKDVTADAWAYDGYACSAYRFDDGGTDTMMLTIARVDDSASTQLGAALYITDHGDGDKVGGRAIGAALELWYDDGAGWELRMQRSDATYGAAGYLAIALGDSAGTSDDFGGGTISPAPVQMHHYLHH